LVILGDEMFDYIKKLENNQIDNEEDLEYLTYIKHEAVNISFGCTTLETNLFLT
jgi:hypothetical protein